MQWVLDRLSQERKWVITATPKGKITEEDMEGQLAAIDFQALELQKKLDDKLSALVV